MPRKHLSSCLPDEFAFRETFAVSAAPSLTAAHRPGSSTRTSADAAPAAAVPAAYAEHHDRPFPAVDRSQAGPLGISMVLSSRLSQGWGRRGPRSFLTQQCPKDIDAAARQGDDGLGV